MQNIQVQVLKETLEMTHNLAVWYFNKLAESDVYQQFEANGQKLNSIYWLAGHLAWSENDLVLKGIHAPMHQADWLEDFKFGEAHTTKGPSWEELKSTAKEIHEMAMGALDKLTDRDLEKENGSGVGFGGKPTIRLTIMHQIRHVGTHCGHLGWIAKLNGIKTA